MFYRDVAVAANACHAASQVEKGSSGLGVCDGDSILSLHLTLLSVSGGGVGGGGACHNRDLGTLNSFN